MKKTTSKIIYTLTDEAPALATHSLLPVIRAFMQDYGVVVDTADISLAGRIISSFPDELEPGQRLPDYLTQLGELTLKREANIIKLPNISASIPQLNAAIAELQDHGYRVPDYPEEPETDAEKELQKRYSRVLGSAVNPVLRQGNSDRRAPIPVREYARRNPNSGLRLREWSADSRTHVSHMTAGDFYGTEKSTTLGRATVARITFTDERGTVKVMKDDLQLQEGEVIDASVMNCRALRDFYTAQIDEARKQGVLLSLHLKATMMKVSDPIMFGHAVSVYYRDVFEKHNAKLKDLGVNPNNGLGDVYHKIRLLTDTKRDEIERDIQAVYQHNPELAMVNSDKGITNLHVPNDIIIDASLPVVIRDGGKMWGPDGKLHDTKIMIPDRCYATIYQEIISDCQRNGAFDRGSMGSVPNVGLMAQKAEEYGSHDKTFQLAANGVVRVVDADGGVLLEQQVEKGDIFRMCQTKDLPVRDWVKLAVERARETGTPAVFWLDENRAHDRELIVKVNRYLPEHDTRGLEIRIMAPVDAMRYSLQRIRAGKDTISVTGNVLRDYLTDLFPIIEIGTSAKMLSIVPLLNGGGLFETGAGGSAPKHVQQFLEEGHLRWDSLGEFSALRVSLKLLGYVNDNPKALYFGETLDEAIGKILDNEKSPSRKVYELDNRGSHFYLALYWAEALSRQKKDPVLQAAFTPVAEKLAEAEAPILEELLNAQGKPVDIGGYYQPDPELAERAMRPSRTFNTILDSIQQYVTTSA